MLDIKLTFSKLLKENISRDLKIKKLKILEGKFKDKFSNIDIRKEYTSNVIKRLFKKAEKVERIIHFYNPLIKKKQKINFKQYFLNKLCIDFVLADEPMDHVWEPFTTRLLLNLVKKDSNVIIGGSYSGDHAVLLMKVLDQSKPKVFCFEPNKKQNLLLKENAKINQLSNYEIISKPLWSFDNIKLNLVGDDAYGKVSKTKNSNKSLISTTIDTFVKKKKIKIDLVMLDIEGSEFQVLKGAKLLLEGNNPPNIIFEVHRKYVNWDKGLEQTKICKFLLKKGYKIFAIRDFQSNVSLKNKFIELIPIKTCFLDGPKHGFNLFATKNDKILKRKIFKYVNNKSPKLLFHKDKFLHGFEEESNISK